MPINRTQQDELFQWLREKGVRDDCQACGAESRLVGDIIAPPALPDAGGTVINGLGFPLVQVVCENCGFVMHFASTPIGLDAYRAQLREQITRSEETAVVATH